MGKQTNIKLRGRVENLIFYQWKGIHCIRTVPARVRQTENTKKIASQFGLAVKSAAKVRLLVKPLLPGPADRAVIYALDGAFRKWLHTNPLNDTAPADVMPAFETFSFNKEARPGKLFRLVNVTRAGGHDISICLPAFNPARDVTAPAGTRHLGVEFMAVIIPFNGSKQADCAGANIAIPYTDVPVPAQQIQLADITSVESLVLIIMTMKYYKDESNMTPINQVRWKPAVIVNSFYN